MDKTTKPLILLAGNSRSLLSSINRIITKHDIDVVIANDGVQAVNMMNKVEYSCLIVDETISRIPANKVIKEFSRRCNKPSILLTNTSSLNSSLLKERNGNAFILKPFSKDTFEFVLSKVMEFSTKEDLTFNNAEISFQNNSISYNGTQSFLSFMELLVFDKISSKDKDYSFYKDKDIPIVINCLNEKLRETNINWAIEYSQEEGGFKVS